MGRIFTSHLEGRVYSCKFCKAHLANVEEVVSKSFHCRDGKAYLFNAVVNIRSGKFLTDDIRPVVSVMACNLLRVILCIQHAGVPEERWMTTGRHKVVDIYCNKCMQAVGWKYIEAFEHGQKYKEGKYILERGKLIEVYSQPQGVRGVIDSRCRL